MSELSLQATLPAPLPELSLTPEGEEMISNALAKLSLIGRVANDADNERAVSAIRDAKETLSLLEKARVAGVAPALEAQRTINAFFKAKSAQVLAQVDRAGRLTSDYAALVMAKHRAEENSHKEHLTQLEREREAALAKVDTHDEREAIQSHFNQRAQLEAQAIPNPVQSAKGQHIKEDWDIVVSDVHLLAKAHPSCVKITPLTGEIKSLLKAGIKVAGVTATKQVVSAIRAPSVRPAIDV